MPRRAQTKGPHASPTNASSALRKASEELERWLRQEDEPSLGGLVELFGEKSFAILFVLLLGVPALPLPTGGATHLFEILAMLLALELTVGRKEIWLPKRWSQLDLAGGRQRRFMARLLGLIRWLERFSRPRLRFAFNRPWSNTVFGLLVIAGSAAAFLAPPFTGLDTLPSLGVVLLSLGVLLEDILLVAVALAVGAVGVALEIVLGAAAIHGLGALL
jgi:hypothetical protein